MTAFREAAEPAEPASGAGADPGIRVAIVHDWLTNLAGSERVALVMKRAFPEAPIFTSVFNRRRVPQFDGLDVRTSFLQRVPLATRRHQLFTLLRERAFRSFDLTGYDVVISSSSAESKAVVTAPGSVHVSYIHTPTRYYWSHYEEYLDQPGLGVLDPLVRRALPRLVGRMRDRDLAAAQRPDVLLASCRVVQDRIRTYYGRESTVLNPPVDVSRFTPAPDGPGDFYLVMARLVPYKRIDVAVEAATRLGRRLVVAGDGSEEAALRRMAGPTVEFVGRLTDDREIAALYHSCRALILPAEEDFGITPLEAMACGRPVIAFRKGGATETVVEDRTGVFFDPQTPEDLAATIERFETMSFDPAAIRAHALGYSDERFVDELRAVVAATLARRCDGRPSGG